MNGANMMKNEEGVAVVTEVAKEQIVREIDLVKGPTETETARGIKKDVAREMGRYDIVVKERATEARVVETEIVIGTVNETIKIETGDGREVMNWTNLPRCEIRKSVLRGGDQMMA